MAFFYYVDKSGQQAGPVPESELSALGITPETYVWTEGMPDWKRAKDVPQLAYLFRAPEQPQPQQTRPEYPAAQPQAPQYAPGQQYGYQQPQPNMPCPPTYLIWSIITTVCCCLIGGIIAIVYSSQVEGAWRSGDYELALKKSNQAKTWNIISLVAGIVFGIIYGCLIIFGGVLSSLN